MPKYIASDTAFVAEKARLRKKRIGSIGCGLRCSQITNPASRARPPISVPSTSGLVQPWPGAWTSA